MPPPAGDVPGYMADLERFLNHEPEPMRYPSLCFKTDRSLYYDLLNEVRQHGEWERWLDVCAEGIEVSATQASTTANTLLAMVSRDRVSSRFSSATGRRCFGSYSFLAEKPTTLPPGSRM